MLLVSKNKRSQLLFRRQPEGDQPPDIVLERELTVSVDPIIVVSDDPEILVGEETVCTVDTGLSLSLVNEIVLSLVCNREG